MGKIGNWKKIGKSSWILDRGNKPNLYCYVVFTESFKKLYGRKTYHGEVELKGISISGSPAYSTKADAEKWCIRWMKKHPYY